MYVSFLLVKGMGINGVESNYVGFYIRPTCGVAGFRTCKTPAHFLHSLRGQKQNKTKD